MKAEEKEKRVRRSERQWRTLLARQQSSGLGVQAFCRSERIGKASFYRWRNLLNDGGDDRAAVVERAPTFVDLGTLNSTDARQARIEIKLDFGEGMVLHLVRR